MSDDNASVTSEGSEVVETSRNKGRLADTPGWGPKQSMFLVEQLIIYSVKLNEGKDNECWKKIAEEMQKYFEHSKATCL